MFSVLAIVVVPSPVNNEPKLSPRRLLCPNAFIEYNLLYHLLSVFQVIHWHFFFHPCVFMLYFLILILNDMAKCSFFMRFLFMLQVTEELMV